MKLNFILPSFPKCPIGGYKIMYEYANMFAERGHDVMIYHVMTLHNISSYRIPHFIRYLRNHICYSSSRPSWFVFNQNIRLKHIPRINDRYVRNADIVMSTMFATALELINLSDGKGRKFNLIQGYELWIEGNRDLLHASYRLPITHIVISDYLADIVDKESGVRPPIIYNGIDKVTFFVKNGIENRKPHTISMLYSTANEVKGTSWGLDALRICRDEIPDLEVNLFGVYSKPKNLEKWFQYHRNPSDLCSLYNSASIFFAPSVTEGWGLPPTEAMFCGCALVCTDIAGHSVYAKDGKTALLVESKNTRDMANKLLFLIRNSDMRIALAKSGNDFIQQFSWEQAFRKMEQLFTKSLI